MENILIVDDEEDILKLISENLLIRGYDVSQANTASSALEKIIEHTPSMMLLDIKLPDFTGWELLRRIRANPNLCSDFPVLIMTASITDASADLKEFPSVIEVLIKPFNISYLISTVRQTMEKNRKKEQTNGADPGSR